MKNRNHQAGFTLIELMIAVLVLSIILAVGIPSYLNYTTRGQVSEGYSLGYGLVDEIQEFYHFNAALPVGLADIGGGTAQSHAGRYVSGVDVAATGEIVVTFGGDASGDIAGDVLALWPYSNLAGDLFYFCHPVTPPAALTQVGVPTNLTTLDADEMPSSCR